jgi:ergothioneine biosynthesis protein EgtB
MSQIAHTPPSDVLATRFAAVRRASEQLAAPLSPEDTTAQSMPDASPVKWHLAHTSWFFETFLLENRPGYRRLDETYRVLFNSYYQAVGDQYSRPERGMITRPGLDEVRAYRRHVDEACLGLLEREAFSTEERALLSLGLHHEQQHQELILTDLKHLLAKNPLHPVYRERTPELGPEPSPLVWRTFPGGLHEIGHEGKAFAFDNEGPRHRVFLNDFALASRLVTNGEFLGFMADGGYERPELWLSDGFATVQERSWEAPLYWHRADGGWQHFTLHGLSDVDVHEPVTHVSAYEADAYARWAQARLANEAEWEVAAGGLSVDGNFVESENLHPAPLESDPSSLAQLFGDVWEWTGSAYSPYPGYQPPGGAIGEYNGKFMANQLVLRGGSCATPRSHFRTSYRNFFYPDARWQFSGIRLARDAG